MRIDARPAAAAMAAGPQAGRAGGPSSFRLAQESDRKTGASRSAAPLATLGAILMLQSEEDPRERRRRSAGRGRDLLDALDQLKAALLSGTVPAARLRAIADRLAAGAGSSGDPTLDAIVAGIELRAQVELAKLGRV